MHTIRFFQPDDYPSVQSIYLQGIASGDATFLSTPPDWPSWDKSKCNDCRLVATSNDQVIGWAALSPVASQPFFSGLAEVSVYVADQAQGQGVGNALLAALVECSEKAGFWTLHSGIFPENKSSIRVHEKNGFRILGVREKPARMADGRWRDVVLMERRSKTVGVD